MTPLEKAAQLLAPDYGLAAEVGTWQAIVNRVGGFVSDGELFYALLVKLAEIGRLPFLEFSEYEVWCLSVTTHEISPMTLRGSGPTPLAAMLNLVDILP